MSIFIFRTVFVYTRCAERTLIRIKQVCFVTGISFRKRFVLQSHALAVLLKRKYCSRFFYGRKFLLSIANSTSQCSAQDLAHFRSKATNRRRDSFPSGHDQGSRSQIFSNYVHCLPACFNIIGCVQKKLRYLLFSISVADWSVLFQLARLE